MIAKTINTALAKNLPALDENLVRIGAFRLASLPFTEDMRIRLYEWKTMMAQKVLVTENNNDKKENSTNIDFTWDPLVVLLRKMEQRKTSANKPPEEYFFVRTMFYLVFDCEGS